MFIKKITNVRYISQGSDNVCRLKLFILFLLFAVSAVLPNASLAATYYVDADSGNDNNLGSSAQPWKTIQRALPNYNGNPQVTAGDTVKIAARSGGGDYGHITYTENGDTGRSNWIMYEAQDPANKPVIKTLSILATTNAYMKWKNIRFENTDSAYTINLQGSYGAGLLPVNATTHVQILNCYIDHTDQGGDAAFIIRWASDIVVDNCEGQGGDPQFQIDLHADGITVSNSNCHHSFGDIFDIATSNDITLENNEIHHVDPNQIKPGGHWDAISIADSTDVIVRANVLHDIGYSQTLYTINDYGTDCQNITFENNLVYTEAAAALVKFYDTNGLVFRNNTIIALNGTGTGAFDSTCSNVTMYNNIIIGPTFTVSANNVDRDYNIIENFSGTMGAHGYELSANGKDISDVEFVDYINDNYQLTENSIARDFGDPTHATTTDIIGNLRDAKPDTGCYEYIPPGPPDTTPPSVPQNLSATAVGESQIDLSWDASNDPESGINHYNIYRDGNNIGQATTTSYSDTGLESVTTYSYKVSAVNGQGLESGRSNTAQATTFSDTTAPSIVSVNAYVTLVEITFSESLDTISAEQINNYSINNGIYITAASLDTDTVTLTTSAHTEGSYTLTVTNVLDTSGNAITQTTEDYIYEEGLAGHWKFDDGSGGTAVDSSGKGNTATLINGAEWTDKGEVTFDGVDDAVEIPTANWSANAGTIALWARAEDFSGTRYLFGHTIGSWSNRIQLYVNEGNLGLGLGDSHTKHANIQTLNVNTWYHITLTWDGTNYVVYINGVARANGPYTGLTALSTLADIGNNGNTSYRDEAFNGIIDEVRVYDRALTVDELSDIALVFLPIGNKSINEGSTLTFEVRTRDPNVTVDINDHNLPSEPNFFFNGGSWNFNWAAEDGDDGTYEANFVAPHGQFVDHETITITVNDVNDVNPNSPPVADAGPDQTVTDTDGDRSEQVTLDGSASTDPDGTIVSWVWSDDLGDTIPNGENVTATLRIGTHTITLTVTDDGGLSSNPPDTVTITVKKENSPPTLEAISHKVVNENSLLSFSISATDPDGDVITYSCPNLPAGAAFSIDTFTWTPTSGQAGSYDVTFIASDGQLEDSETITITVNEPNLSLSDNFDDRDYAGWSVVDEGSYDGPSSWSASTGAMLQTSNIFEKPTLVSDITKLGTYALYAAGRNWTDYTVSLTIRSEDDDAIGLMFRYQDNDNYYRFSWDKQRSYRRLVKKQNGVFTLLAEDSVPYVTGQSYQLEIVAQGTTLQVSIDSTLIFSVTDNSLASGSIALYSWGNQGAYFDNVVAEGDSAPTPTPTPTQTTGLMDNFNDGDFTGWSVVDEGSYDGPSSWSASTGAMLQTSNIFEKPTLVSDITKLGTYALYAAGRNWTDYTVSLTIRSEDDDAIGLMFRYQDNDNYYRFSWDKQRSYRRLVKKQNGVFTLLAEDSVPYVTGQSYQLEIVAQGTTLQVSIDSTLIFSVTDNSLVSGSIALYSWGNQGAYFDNVVVEGDSAPTPTPTPTQTTGLMDNFNDGDYAGWSVVDEGSYDGPSSWSASTGAMLQTSNIFEKPTLVSDITKLGTYALYAAGRNWTDYTVSLTIRSEDDDAIGLMFRYQDNDNYYRFSWDKQRSYRRLVKKQNGVFTLLAEDSVPYVTGQSYQLEIVAQGTTLQVSIDSTLIFSVTDNSLVSGSIALYSWGNQGAYFDNVVVEGL